MSNRHLISPEVLDAAQVALSSGNHWIAYNQTLDHIEKESIQFFESRMQANEFANDNVSDGDSFNVVHINDMKDLLEKILYRERNSPSMSDPDGSGLFNKEGNAFTDALIGHFEQQQLLFSKHLNGNVMNEQNFQYLKDNIKYMGFGEGMNEALEANLKAGQPEFSLSNKTEVNKKPFEVNLNFRKSDNSDMYFFNNYNASLTRSNGEKVDQTFYLNKGKGITAKEAYNLLEGRAVNKDLTTKEGQSYNAWVQLDFDNKDKRNNFETKQFHENYGYDLKEALSKYPIAELSAPDKEDALMHSLKKGNLQSVTMETDGATSKMFVEANPQFKNVTVYDANMKRMQKEDLAQYQTARVGAGNEMKADKKKELQPEKKKEAKQAVADDSTGLKKKTTRKKGISV